MSVTSTVPRWRGSARGQTLVIFAFFLVVLLGVTAITVDYGSLLKVRRDYQNVSDAAVLAGSVFLTRPVNAGKEIAARTAAWESIKDQLGLTLNAANLATASTPVGSPVTDGNPNCSVCGGYRLWVSTPPLGAAAAYTGNYSGNNRVLFAWIERPNTQFFSRVFGLGDRTVSAWATAGSFPNRFAVITLRKPAPPPYGTNPRDIAIDGNGTALRVADGDVGGNWGMTINGVGARLEMTSTTAGDTYGVYLAENAPSPPNWSSSQVVDGAGTPIAVQYHPEVADPNYPAPCGGLITYSANASTAACLEDRTALFTDDHRTTSSRSGDTCTLDPSEAVGPANDRLPTGRYHDIRVDNGECLIFDPTFDQKTGRQNGIVYITGTLDINGGATGGLVLADGVTLVFARDANMTVGSEGIISLNRGNTTNNPFAASLCGGNATGTAPNDCRFGGWTAKAGAGGFQTWGPGLSTTYTLPSDPYERGMAVIVCKSAADCDSGGAPSSSAISVSSGAGIDWRGLAYAPFDNVKLAGQPGHQDVGQLVAWTISLSGGSTINQTFDGPDQATPQLLEPRLGQ